MIKRSYLLTHVTGIPIRIHITLIILLLVAAFRFGFWGVVYTVGIFISVVLHELGHSWVAIGKGCRVHEIMLLPIGGVAKLDHIPTRPRDEFLVAAAGPLTSLILSGIFFLLSGTGPLKFLMEGLAEINLILCLFNLLPSFPMDGGRIFRALMSPKIGRLNATGLAARIGRIMAVALGIFGLLNGQFLTILIALFIYHAAGAEYRAVYMQQMSQDWFSAGQADIEVSPPPYAYKARPGWKKWKNKTSSSFNDLFKDWQ